MSNTYIFGKNSEAAFVVKCGDKIYKLPVKANNIRIDFDRNNNAYLGDISFDRHGHRLYNIEIDITTPEKPTVEMVDIDELDSTKLSQREWDCLISAAKGDDANG